MASVIGHYICKSLDCHFTDKVANKKTEATTFASHNFCFFFFSHIYYTLLVYFLILLNKINIKRTCNKQTKLNPTTNIADNSVPPTKDIEFTRINKNNTKITIDDIQYIIIFSIINTTH